MRKFSDTTRLFFEMLGQDQLWKIAPIPRSAGYLSPGDVVLFKYSIDGMDRAALVVSIKRGPGVFISSRGNKLLACVKLTSVSADVASVVLSKLYKNRKKCSYGTIVQGLSAIFGKDNMRTYDLNKISYLHEISVDKTTLP